jgi:hypothetical protein
MLLKDGTELPALPAITMIPHAIGWSYLINSTSAELDGNLRRIGWTFFYLAGEIRKIGFGFTSESRMKRAVTRVIEAVKLQQCNSLEITQVRTKSFLGLPYTSLVAHARHVQLSPRFQPIAESHLTRKVKNAEGMVQPELDPARVPLQVRS